MLHKNSSEQDTKNIRDLVSRAFGEMTPEIAEVIEAHRIKIGAKHLHVSLGPNATAESIRAELEHIENEDKVLDKYDALKIMEARLAHAINRLGEIERVMQTNFRDFMKEPIEVSKLKSKIRRIIGDPMDVIDKSWLSRYIELRENGMSEQEALEQMNRKKDDDNEGITKQG